MRPGSDASAAADLRSRCAALSGDVAILRAQLDASMPEPSGAAVDASWQMLSDAVRAFRWRAVAAPQRPLRSMIATLASFDRLARIVRQACLVVGLTRRRETTHRFYDWTELIADGKAAIAPPDRQARTGWRRAAGASVLHGDADGVTGLVTCAVQHLLDSADDAEVVIRLDRQVRLDRVWVAAAVPAWWLRGLTARWPGATPERPEWSDAWAALVHELAGVVAGTASLEQTDQGSRWCLVVPDYRR